MQLILSDIHSNLPALEAAVHYMKRTKCEFKVISLGDQIGYGAYPNEVLTLLGELDATLMIGNHEAMLLGLEDFSLYHDGVVKPILWTRGQLTGDREDIYQLPLTIETDRITYVHASPWNPSEFPYIIHWYQAEMAFEALNTDLCFFGHTHVPIAIKCNRAGDNEIIKQRKGWVQLDPESRYLINPGSIGQPRDGNPKASFIVFDEDKWRFRWIRVPYDIRKAQAGILDAGLPEENAHRLEIH